MSTTVSAYSDHGELKRYIARLLETDPDRYATALSVERHKRLTDDEITRMCERLGMGFLADEKNQQRRDALMLKLGRDHRTGAERWDSADLLAIARALEDARTE